uniref:Uncharacterized protein n=1 Tax=Timema cristinae TaxID=61476 RepID=A0A7R9CEH5_TIMCR|nr:unnamed protein product [Timema cristinae]
MNNMKADTVPPVVSYSVQDMYSLGADDDLANPHQPSHSQTTKLEANWPDLVLCLFGLALISLLSASDLVSIGAQSNLHQALVEQTTFGPAMMSSFFFGMSLLEGNSVEMAAAELRVKFFPTFKVGVFIWTTVNIVNYSLIPAQHRIIFIGACSFVWTVFLAYIKQLQVSKQQPTI